MSVCIAFIILLSAVVTAAYLTYLEHQAHKLRVDRKKEIDKLLDSYLEGENT